MYRHIKKPALFKWGASSGPPRQRGPDSFTQRVMVTGFAVLALGSFSSGVLAQDMLPAPSLAGPCNDEIIVEHSPDFDWSSVSTADTYRILVSTDEGFSSFDEKAADSSCKDDCWTAVTGSPGYSGFYLESGIYYWQARAGIKYKDEENKGKGGHWSSTCKFEINEKPKFIEGSATPNAVGDGASVRFTCIWGDHESDALFDVKVQYGSTPVEFESVEKSGSEVNTGSGFNVDILLFVV